MSLSKVVKRFPVLIPCMEAGSLMAAGDVVSQFAIERKTYQEFEWIRTTRFFGLGFILVAPVLRVWYVFLDRKFGSTTKIGIAKKVAADQLLFAPSFLVIFLSSLGALQQKKPNEIKMQIQRDYKDIIVTNWTVWPLVQVCNFSFVPLQHQILVVQAVALFWNTYMAWKTNREQVIAKG